MENDRSILTRRAVLFGVPFLYLVLGLFHPTSRPRALFNRPADRLHARTGRLGAPEVLARRRRRLRSSV
jgi:hypothetical protein